MAIVLRFTPKGATTEKYDRVMKRLEEAGEGAPAGRLYHVSFGEKDNLHVSEIWDSRASFEKFAETLMPILQEVGIDPSEPVELEVYKTVEGTRAGAANS